MKEIVEASPQRVAQAAAEEIVEASPRRVAQVAVGLPPAEQALAEQPLERPVRFPLSPSDRLRISRRSVRCLLIDRHNCCKMPYSFSLLKPDSSQSFRVRLAAAAA